MKCPDGHEMVRDYCSEKIDYVCPVCGFIHRKESEGMSGIYYAQDPLEWCFECVRWGKTCKGTDHPVFCPKIDHDEPEFMENEVRE